MYQGNHGFGQFPQQQASNSVFGKPLKQLIENNALPNVLEAMFNAVGRPAGFDLFSINYSDPQIAGLKQAVDQNGGYVLGQATQQQAAALLVLFFKSLPLPVVPTKYLGQLLGIASIRCQRFRLDQLKVFFSKMPQSSNLIALRLFSCLQATQADPNGLARIFSPTIARQEHESPDAFNPQISGLVADCIANAGYVSLSEQEPVLSDPSQPLGNEPKLCARVAYEYNSTSPDVMSLRVNDTVLLLNALPGGWLEGICNGVRSFLPSGFVELTESQPPQSPAMPMAGRPNGGMNMQMGGLPQGAQNSGFGRGPAAPINQGMGQSMNNGMSQGMNAPMYGGMRSQMGGGINASVGAPMSQQQNGGAGAPMNRGMDMPFGGGRNATPNSGMGTPMGIAGNQQQQGYGFNSGMNNMSGGAGINGANGEPGGSGGNAAPPRHMSEMKIAVVGSGGVGKSMLTLCFVQNCFIAEYDPTIEDSYRKQVTVDDVPCCLNILDTAGQEEYSTMRDMYMRKGDGFLLVFSLTSRQTYDETVELYDKILQVKDADKVPLVLAGNKWDLQQDLEVTKQETEAMGKRLGCTALVTSAKEHFNVDECFYTLIRTIRNTGGAQVKAGKQQKKFCIFL